MPLVALSSLVLAVQSYVEKRAVSSGVSRHDFFFYACSCLVPFAAIMIFLTPFYFNFSYILVIILLVSIVLRYGKMTSIVSTVEHLVPYESEAYMCFSVVLAYIIDCILGIKDFSYWGVLSVFITLFGVFLIADVKLQIKKLRINLLIRIICDVGLGYCARYALIYCSNAMYIFLTNLLIILIFCWRYKFEYHKNNWNKIKLVIVSQFLGFLYLYIGNIVAQQSVTAYAFVRPFSLALCVVIAFFYKDQAVSGSLSGEPRQPKVKDVIAIVFIIAGICLQLL